MVNLSAKGGGTITGTSFHAYGMTALVRVGPDRSTACKIVGELPDGATASHQQPAVMVTNGFGGAWTTSTALGPAEMAVSKDYVALTYSGLGFGGSGCQIELDPPTWDGLAASELVSWLGQLPEVAKTASYPDDPTVGMVGGSYGGGVQFSTAEIDALVPVITWNDLAYSLAPNNETNGTAGLARQTTEPGVLKWEWSTLFFAELYGVAPTGTATLVDRLVSPVRVADTAQPVTIDLPGIVHRYPKGERLELVLASGDPYQGNRTADTYTVTVSRAHPSVLALPVAAASAQDASAPPAGD